VGGITLHPRGKKKGCIRYEREEMKTRGSGKGEKRSHFSPFGRAPLVNNAIEEEQRGEERNLARFRKETPKFCLEEKGLRGERSLAA